MGVVPRMHTATYCTDGAGQRVMHRRLRDEDGLQSYRAQLTKLLKDGAEGGRIMRPAEPG